MMSKQPRRLPSRAAKDLLETTELRVQNPVAAQALWERVLTTAQRKRLGNDLEAAYYRFGGTIGIWKYLRGGHPLRAMVDAALALNLLTPTDSRWLVQELGESHRSVGSPVELEWHKDLGELRLNGKVIRRVRIKAAKNLVIILDGFQECGWPEQMQDSVPRSSHTSCLRDDVKTLNKQLKKIRFYSDGTGEGIRWAMQ